VQATEYLPIHRPAPAYDEQAGADRIFWSPGIKVIDLLVPFAKGGKVGLFGAPGVGKTVNMLELITISPAVHAACPCSRASASVPRGNDFYHEMD